MTVVEKQTLLAMFRLVSAAHDAMDNSEERDEEIVIDKQFSDPLLRALDALDDLPDDRPGYVMGPCAKAQWALRNIMGEAL